MTTARTLLTAALVGALATGTSAQITLGEDWLMDVGFAMDLAVDTSFDDAADNLARFGADQRWDLGTPTVHRTFTVSARAASEGSAAADFPDADLVVVAGAGGGIIGPDAEAYMDRDGDDLFLIGLAGEAGGGGGFLPPLRLSDPFTFQSAPVAFNQRGDDIGSARLALGGEFLGVILGDSTFNGLVDSLGFSLAIGVDYHVDGWGTLRLGRDSFAVLRTRTVREISQALEVKVPFLGWIPIGDFVQLPDSLGGFGTQRTIAYDWLTPAYSYPVASAEADEDENPQELNFLASAVVGTRAPAPAVDLVASWVPGALEVVLGSAEVSAVQLRLLGPDGRDVGVRRDVRPGSRISVPTANLPRGAYLVTAWRGGRLAATRRLVIGGR